MTKAKITRIDLSDFDTSAASDKGAEIELMLPVTNAKSGMFIKVVGKDSEVFRDYTKHNLNERLRKEHQANRKGKDVDAPTAEEAERRAIELLTVCTTGWRSEYKNEAGEIVNVDTIYYKMEELVFNVPNCQRLYTEQLWIRRQVDDAIGDLENFMKGFA